MKNSTIRSSSPLPSGFVYADNMVPTLFKPSRESSNNEKVVEMDYKPESATSSSSSSTFSSSPVSLPVVASGMQRKSVFYSKQKMVLKQNASLVDYLIFARVKGDHSIDQNFLRDHRNSSRQQINTTFISKLIESGISIHNIDKKNCVFLKTNKETIQSVSHENLKKNMKTALDAALCCYHEKYYKFNHFNSTPELRTEDGWYEVKVSRHKSPLKKPMTITGKGFEKHIGDIFNDAKNILEECKKHMKIVCYDSKSENIIVRKFNTNKSYENPVSLIFERKEDAEEWCKAHGGDWLPPAIPVTSPTATAATAGMFSTTNSNGNFTAPPIVESNPLLRYHTAL